MTEPVSAARLQGLKKRYRAEARFRAYGIAALVVTASFLVLLLGDIITKAVPAFTEHRLTLPVTYAADKIDAKGARAAEDLRAGDYQALVRTALRDRFPEVTDRRGRRLLDDLVSNGAADDLRRAILHDQSLIGQTRNEELLLSAGADLLLKGGETKITRFTGQSALSGQVEGESATLAVGADAIKTALRGILPASSQTLLLIADKGTLRITGFEGTGVKGDVVEAFAGNAIALASGKWSLIQLSTLENARKLSDREAVWLLRLQDSGSIKRAPTWRFFTNGDSRQPELAGIRGALTGTLLTLLITLLLCLPLGVGAAIYLEEFAAKSRLSDILEVNINNLAAVPSIVFGLLGLSVFLNAFGMPRSAALVGGLVLALLVLPTIIIASRAALRAVPPSIKEAALGVGASHQQAVFHHVLPLAMPGIMTGTIIGMAHALGETAPLLMIGMIAFIADVPQSFVEAATVLPVQIFLWSDLPEAGFRARTAAAILVLLVALLIMNGAAILLRRRFERRW